MPAPVVLFVYNRLWHTQRTILALRQNSLALESDLIIFSDGPKTEEDGKKVDDVRNFLKSVPGFKSIEIRCSERNKGLATSIIDGVTQVLNKHETIIVLEDDLVTAPSFLRYMNDALIAYRNEDQVISIHGYIYPVTGTLPENFFIKGADCWGWATWRRGWKIFEPDGKKLLKQLTENKLTKEFDFNGYYGYTRMLKKQIKGQNNSWAIRWYASAFLANKLTLYPGKSLVNNIGNDNSGTHSKATNHFETEINKNDFNLRPIEVRENKAVRNMISSYFKRIEPFYIRLLKKIF